MVGDREKKVETNYIVQRISLLCFKILIFDSKCVLCNYLTIFFLCFIHLKDGFQSNRKSRKNHGEKSVDKEKTLY